MKLEYGSGNAAAVLDLATCQVEMYNESGLEGNPFHARFGGRQYYTSQSGMSGAGWLPDRSDVRPVGVLRADVSRPRVPDAGETLPGVRVVVLTTHINRNQQLPLLVVRGQEVAIIEESQLREALLGTLELRNFQEVSLTSWKPSFQWTKAMYEHKLDIGVRWDEWKPGKWGKLSLRRVLELLFWNELFQKDAAAVGAGKEPFFEEMGLHRAVDGCLYRSVGGILRYSVEETVSALSAETGQRFWQTEEERLVRVDQDTDNGTFRLRHQAERADYIDGAPRPVELTLEQVLEIFSSNTLPDWALEALVVAPIPTASYEEAES